MRSPFQAKFSKYEQLGAEGPADREMPIAGKGLKRFDTYGLGWEDEKGGVVVESVFKFGAQVSYEQLISYLKTELEGDIFGNAEQGQKGAGAALLVKIEEEPRYRSPLLSLSAVTISEHVAWVKQANIGRSSRIGSKANITSSERSRCLWSFGSGKVTVPKQNRCTIDRYIISPSHPKFSTHNSCSTSWGQGLRNLSETIMAMLRLGFCGETSTHFNLIKTRPSRSSSPRIGKNNFVNVSWETELER